MSVQSEGQVGSVRLPIRSRTGSASTAAVAGFTATIFAAAAAAAVIAAAAAAAVIAAAAAIAISFAWFSGVTGRFPSAIRLARFVEWIWLRASGMFVIAGWVDGFSGCGHRGD